MLPLSFLFRSLFEGRRASRFQNRGLILDPLLARFWPLLGAPKAPQNGALNRSSPQEGSSEKALLAAASAPFWPSKAPKSASRALFLRVLFLTISGNDFLPNLGPDLGSNLGSIFVSPLKIELPLGKNNGFLKKMCSRSSPARFCHGHCAINTPQ